MTDEKRRAGQVASNGHWLVLTESSGQPGVGFTHRCGQTIQGKTVYYSVHFKEFTLAGGGETRSQVVPYCPACETEPDSNGGIITE